MLGQLQVVHTDDGDKGVVFQMLVRKSNKPVVRHKAVALAIAVPAPNSRKLCGTGSSDGERSCRLLGKHWM